MIRLGVNIDHVATVRQARRINEPDPAWAAVEAELGGADQITLHLREDRRHIQDADLANILAIATVPVNLEMAVTDEMVAIALNAKPYTVCLVPEKREEVTTEGGLDVAGRFEQVSRAVHKLKNGGVKVSLFIDPDPAQVKASALAGATAVELHTGAYAERWGTIGADHELARLSEAALMAHAEGVKVHAGHGLNLKNLPPVVKLPYLEELNIGHALIGRAIFVGLRESVAQYKKLINTLAHAG
jgi:pyridoxine 5-phosphate synthase